MLQRAVDGGLFSMMLSGWQPIESQLALSSKFVPIISNLVRMALPEDKTRPNYRVGDILDILTEQPLKRQRRVPCRRM